MNSSTVIQTMDLVKHSLSCCRYLGISALYLKRTTKKIKSQAKVLFFWSRSTDIYWSFFAVLPVMHSDDEGKQLPCKTLLVLTIQISVEHLVCHILSKIWQVITEPRRKKDVHCRCFTFNSTCLNSSEQIRSFTFSPDSECKHQNRAVLIYNEGASQMPICTWRSCIAVKISWKTRYCASVFSPSSCNLVFPYFAASGAALLPSAELLLSEKWEKWQRAGRKGLNDHIELSVGLQPALQLSQRHGGSLLVWLLCTQVGRLWLWWDKRRPDVFHVLLRCCKPISKISGRGHGLFW